MSEPEQPAASRQRGGHTDSLPTARGHRSDRPLEATASLVVDSLLADALATDHSPPEPGDR